MTHHLSHSQFNNYTTCGERYRLERVVRVPKRPGWSLIGGNTVHTLTEEHDLRLLGVDVPERTWGQVFEELTAKAEEESGFTRDEFTASGRASAKWPNKENPDWWAVEGPAMVRRWENFRRIVPWDLWVLPTGEPAIELEFNLTLLDGEVEIKGFIDRVFVIDGHLAVVDLKSGSRPQPSPRQLGTYKLAVEAEHGVDVPYGTFWDARSGSTAQVADLSRFTPARLEYQYKKLAEARERNLFLPNPSNMCNSCSVRDFCYELGGDRVGEISLPWEPLRVYGTKEAAA